MFPSVSYSFAFIEIWTSEIFLNDAFLIYFTMRFRLVFSCTVFAENIFQSLLINGQFEMSNLHAIQLVLA